MNPRPRRLQSQTCAFTPRMASLYAYLFILFAYLILVPTKMSLLKDDLIWKIVLMIPETVRGKWIKTGESMSVVKKAEKFNWLNALISGTACYY